MLFTKMMRPRFHRRGMSMASTSNLSLPAAGSIREIDAAFADLVHKGADSVVVGSSSFLAGRGGQLATLCSGASRAQSLNDRYHCEGWRR